MTIKFHKQFMKTPRQKDLKTKEKPYTKIFDTSNLNFKQIV